jgi:glycosyltransferase involved in cell wall biosynthesis
MKNELEGVKLLYVSAAMSLRVLFHGQLAHMRAQGLKVIAVASPDEHLDKIRERNGVEVHPVPMPRRITPMGDLVALVRLCRLLRKLRPEIVHASTPKGGLLGMMAAWLTRVPVRVYGCLGLPFETATGFRRKLLMASERVSCKLAHTVICVAPSVRRTLIDAGLAPAGTLRVIGSGGTNGVDAQNRFNPANVPSDAVAALRARLGVPADAPLVAFVGRVVRDKGVVELSDAWERLRERVPDAHLLLVGPVEPQDPVPGDVLAGFRADPRVHMAGFVEEMTLAYAAADIVVLPTYREGLPNVPLEAAAMARPVVCSDIPGCADAVNDGVTGTLFPVRDAAALAAAIERYLLNPDLREQHGRAGREHVLKNFRQEVIWQGVYEVFRELYAANVTGSPSGSVGERQAASH